MTATRVWASSLPTLWALGFRLFEFGFGLGFRFGFGFGDWRGKEKAREDPTWMDTKVEVKTVKGEMVKIRLNSSRSVFTTFALVLLRNSAH